MCIYLHQRQSTPFILVFLPNWTEAPLITYTLFLLLFYAWGTKYYTNNNLPKKLQRPPHWLQGTMYAVSLGFPFALNSVGEALHLSHPSGVPEPSSSPAQRRGAGNTGGMFAF